MPIEDTLVRGTVHLQIILCNDGTVLVPDVQAVEEWSKRTGKQIAVVLMDVDAEPAKVLIDAMDMQDRGKLIDWLKTYYCVCGSPDTDCKCWNDE